MNNCPLVSVVVPAYNHESYVGVAIESVLGQSYDHLEIIVIDDASKDQTWEVIQAFGDGRLRTTRHEENRGAQATINEGLAAARGEFIAILNSDDVFSPDRIEAGLACLQGEAADLVGTDITLIDPDGQPWRDHWWLKAFDALKDVWRTTGDWPATLLEGNVFMTSSNFLFSRAWYEVVGPFADYRYVLDYDWLLRGLAAGRRLAWLDRPLLQYRWHETNTIAERPMAANVECAAMLRSHLPGLLATSSSQSLRLEHLASQWGRMDRYVAEIGATLRHEAVQAALAERDTAMEKCSAALAQCEWTQMAILNSPSYRIGRLVAAPGRWARRLLRGSKGGA
jgi:GT2 family glycosyltransferase